VGEEEDPVIVDIMTVEIRAYIMTNPDEVILSVKLQALCGLNCLVVPTRGHYYDYTGSHA
jgi:hypothetical protein